MPALVTPARAISLAGLCVGALALGACGDSGSEKAAQIKIGVVASLSGTGGDIGTEQVRAIRLGVDRINAGGALGDTKLTLVVADARSRPALAATEMRRLIVDDKVAAVLGPTLSIDAVLADPVANRLRTPVLAISNTAPGIVGRCPYKCEWIWRNSLGADVTVAANVAYFVQQRRPRSAALLHAAEDLLATSETRVARAEFRTRGVRIAADVALPPPGAPTTAVAGEVATALRSRPEVLFVSASDDREGPAVLRAARGQGFRGPILAGDVLNDAGATAAAGAASLGVRSGAAWFGGNDFPANTDFVRAFTSAFRTAPDQFGAQAYSGVAILAQAIDRGDARGSDLSDADRRAAIQKGLGKVALTTPLGPFRFTRDHDVDQIVWILAGNGRGGHSLLQFCDPGC